MKLYRQIVIFLTLTSISGCWLDSLDDHCPEGDDYEYLNNLVGADWTCDVRKYYSGSDYLPPTADSSFDVACSLARHIQDGDIICETPTSSLEITIPGHNSFLATDVTQNGNSYNIQYMGDFTTCGPGDLELISMTNNYIKFKFIPCAQYGGGGSFTVWDITMIR